MARSEARLQFGMWRAGLDGLGPYAKLLYAVLLTEPTLNHCGVGAMRLSRWAKDCSLTIADTEKALAELADGEFVVVDENTEELLVRTLIRNDGVASQPYVLKGALREAVLTTSPRIRHVLAAELRKLPPKQADGTSKVGKKVVYPDPHATADALSPRSPEPPRQSRKEPDALFDANPSERVSNGSSSKGFETLHGGGGGGGGGGGNSSCVATGVEISAGKSSPKRAATGSGTQAETPNKIAQRLARVYHDRVKLSSFVAVMKIVKRALDADYTPDAIEAALHRLADDNRSVTADALRIELDGPPVRSTGSPPQPADRITGWQNLKQTGTDGRVFYAITGGDST